MQVVNSPTNYKLGSVALDDENSRLIRDREVLEIGFFLRMYKALDFATTPHREHQCLGAQY